MACRCRWEVELEVSGLDGSVGFHQVVEDHRWVHVGELQGGVAQCCDVAPWNSLEQHVLNLILKLQCSFIVGQVQFIQPLQFFNRNAFAFEFGDVGAIFGELETRVGGEVGVESCWHEHAE